VPQGDFETSDAAGEKLNAPTVEQINACLNQPRFRQLTWKIAGDRWWEDCIQEARIKAWMNLDTFRAESRLDTWLFQIVRNIAINMMRRSIVRRAESLDATENLDHGGRLNDHNSIRLMDKRYSVSRYQSAIADSIVTACQTLKQKDKQLILQRFRDEKQLGEIARELNVHQSNVTRRIARTCDRLRQHIRLALLYKHGLSEQAVTECMEDFPENSHYIVSVLDEIGRAN